MTVSLYSLPIDVTREVFDLTSSPVEPGQVSVVVPVFNDAAGLDVTLRSLAALTPSPRRVIVVDDGSVEPVSWRHVRELLPGAMLARLPWNRGAAAARNAALRRLNGGWVYCTDTACRHPRDLLQRLSAARARLPADTVAIVGPVEACGDGRIARYFTEQANLCPPMLDESPQTLVTCNALLFHAAAKHVGFFDERFPAAGAEDFDFGLRLRRVGRIGWVEDAIVRHDFEESIVDFDSRFRRYGYGMRILAEKWAVDLAPFHFPAMSPDLQDLAVRQVRMMMEGYGRCRGSR